MTLFMISHDVRSINHDYTQLYAALNRLGAAHLQNSMWLADLTGTAASIRDSFRVHMHPDDTVAVIQLAYIPDWATANVRPGGEAWLKARSP